MEAIGGVLSAFGLAASEFVAGNWRWIGALVLLGAVEFFADKIPAVNHANDVIQTFVRPAAGAVLFAASTNVVTDIQPVVAMVAGVLIAGGVHVAKSAAVRPALSATTAGVGNVPVSIAEDVVATILSILAIVVPVVVVSVVAPVAAGATPPAC